MAPTATLGELRTLPTVGEINSMPHLLFVIWEGPERQSFEVAPVTERGVEVRRQIASRSALRHCFRARSNFEA